MAVAGAGAGAGTEIMVKVGARTGARAKNKYFRLCNTGSDGSLLATVARMVLMVICWQLLKGRF